MYNEGSFRFFFDNMKQLVFLMEVREDEFYYKNMNQSAIEIYGRELIGQPLKKLTNKGLYEYIVHYYQIVKETKEPTTYRDVNIFNKSKEAYETALTPIWDQEEQTMYILAVTSHINNQREKEENFALIESFLEHTSDTIIIFSADETVVRVNAAFEHMFGFNRSEVIGMKHSELPVLSKDVCYQSQTVPAKVRAGQSMTINEEMRITKDGQAIPVSINYSPIYNSRGEVVAYSSIYRDITPLKQLEAEVEKGKEKYKSLFTHHNSGVCIVDLNGQLIKVNEALEKMTGHSAEQLKSLSYHMLIKKFSVVFHTDKHSNIFDGETHRGEITMRNEGGEKMFVTYSIVPIVVDENVTGLFIVLQDHTKETEATMLLTKTMKDLENMKHALDESAIVVSVNKKGYVTYVNDMFVDISGYSEDEAIGSYYGDVGLNTEHEELLRTIRGGSVWRGEVANRNKYGQIYWVYKAVVPLKNLEGDIVEYISVHTDITERKHMENQLHFEAFHDGLTKLPNREMLYQNVNKAISKGTPGFVLLFLDCDNFKQINDTYGHQVGDEFLIKYSQHLQKTIRSTDAIYRLGGDEFIIVLQDTNPLKEDQVHKLIQRIQENLQELWQVDKYELNVTTTIGVAMYPTDGTTVQELIECADIALYEGKRAGKNNVTVYDDEQLE
ncbi:sensor domain-containing protein [Priestia sp. GS2]|uniref:sensor domain-containing protein n=1 Tax=Priestia sp. GS2 TaxID=3117403 RepID=UPI002EDB8745